MKFIKYNKTETFNYYSMLSKYNIKLSDQKLTNDEIKDYITLYRETNDVKYRDIIITRNLYFILSVVNYYSSIYKQFSIPELFSSGVEGYMQGIDKYDINNNTTRLNTFAVFDIRKNLQRYIYSNYSLLSIPKYALENKIEEVNKQIDIIYESSNDNSDIADIFEIDNNETVSIFDKKISVNNDINDKNCYDINIDSNIYNDNLRKSIGILNSHEKFIVYNVFGINCEQKSQKEIAEYLGISTSNLCKKKNIIFNKLKKHMIDNNIEDDMISYMHSM